MASAWGEIVGRGVLAWIKHKPFSKEAKARRKARRAAKHGQSPATEGVSMNPFPQGTQTLSGIAVLVLTPWLAKYGIDDAATQAIVAAAGTLIGTVIGVLGYLRRKKLPAE